MSKMMRSLIQAFSYLLRPTANRFERAVRSPQRSQSKIQQRLVNQLKRCEYGEKYKITSVEDWHKLPIVNYEDIAPWTARSQAHPNILTSEKILFYEPTSGSSGPKKQIPYTVSLRRSFNHLFCIWAYDLIKNGPVFSRGKIYFSITPSFSKVENSTGTTDDSDYLDPWLRWTLKPFLVIVPAAKTPEDFQEKLAKTLLIAEDLEIVSIWSPSFLTAQLTYIQENQVRLHKLLKGELSEARSHLLTQASISWEKLWPQLKLISCWDSMTAADSAQSLRSHFPHTLVQGKGLLATEAPMTVPLVGANGYVPLLEDIYFEFEDMAGQCHLLHQLEIGQTYEVIISQLGGLYRYRMGDTVRVTHYFLQTPCLEFCGRSSVSDLVGEKLSVQFVSDTLASMNLSEAHFQSLLPVQRPEAHYVLLLDRTSRDLVVIAQTLEKHLCESFHYRLARQLNQIAPARVVVSASAAETLMREKMQAGQRMGDIKYEQLSRCYENLAFLTDA